MNAIPEHRLHGRTVTGRTTSEPELQKLPFLGELLPHQKEIIEKLEAERARITGIDFGAMEQAVLAGMTGGYGMAIIDSITEAGDILDMKYSQGEFGYDPIKIERDRDGRAEQRAYFEPAKRAVPDRHTVIQLPYVPTFTSSKPLTKRQRRRLKGKSHA